jgi:hypothetical protein
MPRRYPEAGSHIVDLTLVASATVSTVLSIGALVEVGAAVHRRVVDLTGKMQFELNESHGSGSSSGARFGLQYTLDLTGATGWTWLNGDNGAAQPTGGYVDATTAAVTNRDGLFTIAPAARTRVLIRPCYWGGATGPTYNVRSCGGYAV